MTNETRVPAEQARERFTPEFIAREMKICDAATPWPWSEPVMMRAFRWIAIRVRPRKNLTEFIDDAVYVHQACENYRPALQQIATLTAERDALKEDMRRFRYRIFGPLPVSGCSHSTACAIWGDDGLGGTAEGFKEPLPCTCGALANFSKRENDRLATERDTARANALLVNSTLADQVAENDRLTAALRYALHAPNCTYREWECSQPGCGETHSKPCNCRGAEPSDTKRLDWLEAGNLNNTFSYASKPMFEVLSQAATVPGEGFRAETLRKVIDAAMSGDATPQGAQEESRG